MGGGGGGSHFHCWIDNKYNGVTFLVELLEWGRTFSGVIGKFTVKNGFCCCFNI